MIATYIRIGQKLIARWKIKRSLKTILKMLLFGAKITDLSKNSMILKPCTSSYEPCFFPALQPSQKKITSKILFYLFSKNLELPYHLRFVQEKGIRSLHI